MNVSVLVLTLNEERNIERCLGSLSWCDDIIVVDSFSSDATVEIARRLGARVVQRRFDSFAGQRNFALGTIPFKHPWVLHLDADEVMTPELRSELASLPTESEFDCYKIASRLMMGDKWLKHAGMFPVYQVRLTRVAGFEFEQVGHGQRESLGYRIGTMKKSYLHFGFSKGLQDWFERHDRYALDEARAVVTACESRPKLLQLFSADPTSRRRALKQFSYRLPFRPMFRFVYMYIARGGFLDGVAGYRYAKMMSVYEHMIDSKVEELRSKTIGQAETAGAPAKSSETIPK